MRFSSPFVEAASCRFIRPKDVAIVGPMTRPGRRVYVLTKLCFALVLLAAPLAASSAEPKKKELPLPGEVFSVAERTAFLIPANEIATDKEKPWVWYAPTLANLPSAAERWMFQQFLDAGISIAGIDVGESYGSPAGRQLFSDLYEEMTKRRGYSKKPVLLGRSRGGLMTLCWAAENPDKVAAFAGIYPVCNVTSYPGIVKAAPAYNMTPDQLKEKMAEHNPVDRLAPLARSRVPLFAIHGDVDKLVPLDVNSGLLKERYTALGGSMQLIVPPGQGHNMWTGFFECRELVEFVKKHARPAAPRLGFQQGENGEFTFDTGVLAGKLRRDGASLGLAPVVESTGKTELAGKFGLFSVYRILTSETRYGKGAWDWPSTAKLMPDGAVENNWAAEKDRPFTLRSVYRWSSADTLDMEIEARAEAALPTFEVFLASYFSGFPKCSVQAKPGFVETVKTNGVWQAFPRNDTAVRLIQDGRWQRPPNPVVWTIMPAFAAPLAIRRDDATGLTALILSPPEDCFAVMAPYGEDSHRSVYLSLFGRDLKPGETVRGRARLVVRKNLTDGEAVEMYKEYSKRP